MELPELSGKVVAFSLTALPVCYALNHLSEFSHPLGMAMLSAMILALLFVALSSLAQGDISHDPLFVVFTIFSFTSLIDLFIALEEDDYVTGLMEFYTREREPYLCTAHGIFSCYWNGTVHYLLYLTMTGAIAKRKRYRSLGLYWLGSLVMSIMVFVPGNILGKYSSELRLSFLLNIPYVSIPCWAGLRLFSQDRGPAGYTANMIAEEHKKGLLQRPWDLALFIFLLLAGLFTIFRGLVVLDCPTDSCFIYVYQYEPYLRDPVAYPKIQMLVFLFYALPFFILAAYGLLRPGCTWLPDWALVFAGAMGQNWTEASISGLLRPPMSENIESITYFPSPSSLWPDL
ncbi:transmembrane 6 superfamily member 2 isoform X2 [Vombatus ursinus]|uniref:transmembrane 6 superfamily member 2 isoform X2 n=1 Tax=Vombatus ursinus TaxID=29139 RepID=UPI000FFCFDA9|nr:transmembrane 6 superfamily member 2 isoform X2 [Vombatus ursinus]